MKSHIKNFTKAMEENGILPHEYFCAVCGSTEILDIHHILFLSQKGTNKFDNLICLCREHHNDAHGNRITKEELFNLKKV